MSGVLWVGVLLKEHCGSTGSVGEYVNERVLQGTKMASAQPAQVQRQLF